MFSVLQSREFGFRFRDISRDELVSINYRRLCTEYYKYIDNNAATKVYRKNKKDVFIPNDICKYFVRAFEYGARKMGYWSCKHLIIQLKDCTDVLRAIY